MSLMQNYMKIKTLLSILHIYTDLYYINTFHINALSSSWASSPEKTEDTQSEQGPCEFPKWWEKTEALLLCFNSFDSFLPIRDLKLGNSELEPQNSHTLLCKQTPILLQNASQLHQRPLEAMNPHIHRGPFYPSVSLVPIPILPTVQMEPDG